MNWNSFILDLYRSCIVDKSGIHSETFDLPIIVIMKEKIVNLNFLISSSCVFRMTVFGRSSY